MESFHIWIYHDSMSAFGDNGIDMYFWSLTKSHFEWIFITYIQNLNHENKFWSDWSNSVIITIGWKGLAVVSGALVVSSQQ